MLRTLPTRSDTLLALQRGGNNKRSRQPRFRPARRPLPSAAAATQPVGDSDNGAALPPAPPAPATLGGKIKRFFTGAKLDKQRLASLGSSALLSYGAVSNVNAVTLLIAAWVAFTRQTGLSPLAPGQFGKYVVIYSGLYAVIGNALRPVRFSISVALSPLFERLVAAIQKRLGCSKQAAFAATVVLVNICGSFTYLFVGLWATTTVLHLPLLP